jgi:hypothetical protein
MPTHRVAVWLITGAGLVGAGLVIGLLKAANVQNTAGAPGTTGPINPDPLAHPVVCLGITMAVIGLLLLLGISARLAWRAKTRSSANRGWE